MITDKELIIDYEKARNQKIRIFYLGRGMVQVGVKAMTFVVPKVEGTFWAHKAVSIHPTSGKVKRHPRDWSISDPVSGATLLTFPVKRGEKVFGVKLANWFALWMRKPEFKERMLKAREAARR